MSIVRARRAAASLLERAGIGTIPVDVNAVAQAVGLKVIYEPLGEISGLLVTSDSKALIGVHSGHPIVRQRFTVAHEIGHFVLQHQFGAERVHVDEEWKVSARDSRSSEGRDWREVEANQFAASLLMPEEFVKSRAAALRGSRPRISESEIVSLAREFRVSDQAMAYRLQNLGL